MRGMGWGGEREKQLVILACYSSPLLMCLGLPLSDRQVAHYAIGGEKPAGRADTPKARVRKREWERECGRVKKEKKKNESWKENDRVHLNGPVVNALWDWAEEGETGECSVCSITPHKSGGLLSLPVLPLNYLSPVHTYSSSLMASSHCSSHATSHHGKSLHTCYAFPWKYKKGMALRLLSASRTRKIRNSCKNCSCLAGFELSVRDLTIFWSAWWPHTLTISV